MNYQSPTRAALGILLLLAAHAARAQMAPLLPPNPNPLPAPPAGARTISIPGLPDYPVAAPPAPPPLPRTARAPAPTKPAHILPVPAPPHVATREIVFGQSAQGRALTATVLDNGTPDPDTVTLIFGGFHGNERATPGVVERLRRALLQMPQVWPRRRVVLVGIANPDGWAAGTRINARGVDINRNFPDGWAPAARAARYLPGPRPASEPETQAIISLVARVHPSKIISLHSPLRCLNWTGDVGRAMAQAMAVTDHLPVTARIGYPTPGSFGDFCGAHGIGIVTLELAAGQGADAAWQQNRDAFLAAINLRPSGRE